YKERKWDTRRMLSSGGMPSSHSSTVQLLPRASIYKRVDVSLCGGLESMSIRRIQGIGYGVLEFLGVDMISTDILKNHKKTVKNGQARTRESEEYKKKPKESKPKPEKSNPVNMVNKKSTNKRQDPKCFTLVLQVSKVQK
ncbi:acid phosphatase/vanadium-dependent haloperoxidase-related protein, partial [Tanacetum coccineum]